MMRVEEQTRSDIEPIRFNSSGDPELHLWVGET